MNSAMPLGPEMKVLAWSIGLLAAHIMIQAVTVLRERGAVFSAGPRDDAPPLGRMAARAQRALDNYKEMYPVFVALALGLAVTGRSGGIAEVGAWTWLAGRIVYLPLYLFGVPWLRSLFWGVAAVGLILMFVRFAG